MLIINTPATFTQQIQKMSEDRSVAKTNDKMTMFSAVYNICVICIAETIKLLGAAIVSKATNDVKKVDVDRKIDVTPKISRRSNSKVVCVQSIKVDPAWLKQISSRQQMKNQAKSRSSTTSTATATETSSKPKSHKTTSRPQRVRHMTFPGCHRPSSSSLQQLFSRRRSCPNSLEVIREEDESC